MKKVGDNVKELLNEKIKKWLLQEQKL